MKINKCNFGLVKNDFGQGCFIRIKKKKDFGQGYFRFFVVLLPTFSIPNYKSSFTIPINL